ncbi:hypothetical protein IFDJLNFL_5466 [Methylobacterium dankookense]|uniref:Uncharacterized protein n=1 Tax=Methylobacterium dankookense TaxID=560405 RepID=A0ABQ4RQ83_9HYPH|nr:hypothetical protein IFDJLNFL_5466 [Methylobacterium dankookense]
MAAATSRLSAPMTGATAAMAELPQMALPQAISSAMRTGSPRPRQMAQLARMVSTTAATMPVRSAGPEATMAPRLTEAPSRVTATSSTCLAEKAMPALKRAPGTQAVRMAMPIRMASTRAST